MAPRCRTRLPPGTGLALAAAIVAVCLLSQHAFEGVDEHHDGLMLVPAVEVAQGACLYRDVFSMYGPMTCLIQALGVLVLGPELAALRWVTLLCYGLSAALLVVCARRLLPVAGVGVVLLLWLLLSPAYHAGVFHSWPSVYAMLFQFATWHCLLAWVETRGTLRPLCLAGAFGALAFWSKQTVGLALLPVLLALPLAQDFLGRRRPTSRTIRAELVVLAGWLAASCPFLVYFGLRHALPDLYEYVWAFPKVVARHYGYLSWAAAKRCLALRDPVSPLVELAFGVAVLLWWPRLRARHTRPGVHLAFAAVLTVLMCLLAVRYGGDLDSWMGREPLKLMMSPAWNLFPAATVGVAGWAIVARLAGAGRHAGMDGGLLLVTGLVALSSWLQYYPVPCQRHGFWAAGPMLVCLVWLLARCSTLVPAAASSTNSSGGAEPGTRSPELASPWPGSAANQAAGLDLQGGDTAAGPARRRQPGRGGWAEWVVTGLVLLALCRAFLWAAVQVTASRSDDWVRLRAPPVLRGISVPVAFAAELQEFLRAVRRELDRRPQARVLMWGDQPLPLLYFGRSIYPRPHFLTWGPLLDLGPELNRRRLMLMTTNAPLVVTTHRPGFWEPRDSVPAEARAFLSDFYTPVWQAPKGRIVLWGPCQDFASRLATRVHRISNAGPVSAPGPRPLPAPDANP